MLYLLTLLIKNNRKKAHVQNSFNEFCKYRGSGIMHKYYTNVKDCYACAALYVLGAAAFYENRDLYFY